MSRIGKMPIASPAGVTVEFKDGIATVKGAKGVLTREIVGNIGMEVVGNELIVKALDDKADTNASTAFTERSLQVWLRAYRKVS